MSRFFRAMAALMLSVVAYAQSPPAHPLQYIPIKTPDAKGINLRKYRGKELILVVFSTQCDECIATLGVLSKIQKDLGPRGLQVIGIAGNENAAYTVGPIADRYKFGFPLGFLTQDAVIKLTNIKKDDHPFVPIVMFVDSTGVVRVQYFGNDPAMKQQDKVLRAVADSLLKWQVQHAAAAKAAAAKAEPKPDSPPPAKPEP
jgi:peroxiredoxin